MDAGRSRSTVVVVLIVAAGVYQGCCYVFGYYYAKDRATRSHQTVHPRQRCVCIVAYGIWKECLLFSLPLVFDRLRRVEKKSVVVVVSPLVALMKDQVSDCFHESRGVVYRTKMARTTQRGAIPQQFGGICKSVKSDAVRPEHIVYQSFVKVELTSFRM